jgi:hypothetical protein
MDPVGPTQAATGYGGGPIQATAMGGGGGAPAKKKGGAGLIIGLVVALLVLGGGAAAAWMWLRSSGPELAKYVPKDAEVYVEVPSFTKALVSFVDMDPIDKSALDPDKRSGELYKGFAKAFDLKEDDAKAFFTDMTGVAFAGRDLDDEAHGAMLIGFGSSGAVEKFLKSERLAKDEKVGSGMAYHIEKRDEEDTKDMKWAERAFSELSHSGEKSVFVWFADQKLLVIGDTDYVEDISKVLGGKKDSLKSGNDAFKSAKWPSGSAMIAWVDSKVVDDDDIKKDFMNGVGPFLGSMRFVDAGMVTTLSGELKGKKLPDDKSIEKPSTLELPNKVPADTLAYLAFSTKTGMTGEEAQKQIIKNLEAEDEKAAEKFEEAMEQSKEKLGLDIKTFYDLLGDEAILAVTVDDDLDFAMIEKKDKEALEHVGVVFALQIKDEAKAKKVVKKAQEELEELGKMMKAEISDKDGGFMVEPRGRLGAGHRLAHLPGQVPRPRHRREEAPQRDGRCHQRQGQDARRRQGAPEGAQSLRRQAPHAVLDGQRPHQQVDARRRRGPRRHDEGAGHPPEGLPPHGRRPHDDRDGRAPRGEQGRVELPDRGAQPARARTCGHARQHEEDGRRRRWLRRRLAERGRWLGLGRRQRRQDRHRRVRRVHNDGRELQEQDDPRLDEAEPAQDGRRLEGSGEVPVGAPHRGRRLQAGHQGPRGAVQVKHASRRS